METKSKNTSDQLICNTDIFGKSLEEAMELEVPNSQFPQEIPLALDLIFCCLEMKNFEAEILLQADVENPKVKAIRKSFSQGILPSTIDEDTEVLAGILRLYLSELPSPLIPYKFYNKFLEITVKKFKGVKDKGGVKLFQSLFESDSFPNVNRVVIKRLLGILQRATSSWWSTEAINKKLIEEYSRFFLRKEDSSSPSSKELETLYKTVYILLHYSETLFPQCDELDSNKRRLSLIRKGERTSMRNLNLETTDSKREWMQKAQSSIDVFKNVSNNNESNTTSPKNMKNAGSPDNLLRSQFKKYKEKTDLKLKECTETISQLKQEVNQLTEKVEQLMEALNNNLNENKKEDDESPKKDQPKSNKKTQKKRK